MKKKLKILSKYKTPLPLNQAVGIKIMLPYEDGRTLEKNIVDILDPIGAIIEITLTDFELQGLKIGNGQNFMAEVLFPDRKEIVLFAKGLNVEMVDERKVWR